MRCSQNKKFYSLNRKRTLSPSTEENRSSLTYQAFGQVIFAPFNFFVHFVRSWSICFNSKSDKRSSPAFGKILANVQCAVEVCWTPRTPTALEASDARHFLSESSTSSKHKRRAPLVAKTTRSTTNSTGSQVWRTSCALVASSRMAPEAERLNLLCVDDIGVDACARFSALLIADGGLSLDIGVGGDNTRS